MIQITTGDFLKIEGIDGNTGTMELSKWVCDKIYDKLVIKNAYGNITLGTKELPIKLNGSDTSDLSYIRLTINANW